jgi:putative membrane protein
MRWLVSIGAIMPLAVGPALAQGAPDPTWTWQHGWGVGGMMLGGGLAMLLFWAGAILLVVLLVRLLGGFGPQESINRSRPTALEILQERYARGEIDKPEYDERRRTLMSS